MRQFLLGSALFSFVAIPGALADTTPRPAAQPACTMVQQQLRQAFALHDAGQYIDAAAEFLFAAPKVPAARSFEARSLMEAGMLSAAYQEATLAVQQAPNLAVTHFMLAVVNERRGALQDAMSEYQTVLTIDHTNAASHNNLGGLFYMQEDFTHARQETEEALRLNTDTAGTAIAMANLAEFDALQGNLKSAEQKLDQALEADPELAVPYFGLATIYDVTGRGSAALTMTKNGLELDPHGATRRSSSYVWPELKLEAEGLQAEVQGNTEAAREAWTALKNLELTTGLRWQPLSGRADAHLAQLSEQAAAEGLAHAMATQLAGAMSIVPSAAQLSLNDLGARK